MVKDYKRFWGSLYRGDIGRMDPMAMNEGDKVKISARPLFDHR